MTPRPTLHRGKLAKAPKVVGVRPLTREDMLALQGPRPPQNRPKAMRETHHRLARMVAAGFRTEEILRLTGYSYNRLLQLRHDPAFCELVAAYKDKVDEAYVRGVDEFWETSTSNMLRAERKIEDRLDEDDDGKEKISLKDLMALTSDRADRFGYSKKIVNRNENLDFAKMMEQVARASGRSNVIDAKQQFGYRNGAAGATPANQGATLAPDEIPASRLVTSGDDGGTDG